MDELFGHRMPDILDDFSEEAAIVLHSGDCLDAIKNIPRGCVQLIITSPPHNAGRSYERNMALEENLKLRSLSYVS
jgi:DNA modification methylase